MLVYFSYSAEECKQVKCRDLLCLIFCFSWAEHILGQEYFFNGVMFYMCSMYIFMKNSLKQQSNINFAKMYSFRPRLKGPKQLQSLLRFLSSLTLECRAGICISLSKFPEKSLRVKSVLFFSQPQPHPVAHKLLNVRPL